MKNPKSIRTMRAAEEGLTLVEMLVSTAIFTICIGIALTGLVMLHKSYYNIQMVNQAHNEVRKTTDFLTQVIRSSPTYSVVYTNGVPAGDGVPGNELRVLRHATFAFLRNSPNANTKMLQFTNALRVGFIPCYQDGLGGGDFATMVVSNAPAAPARTLLGTLSITNGPLTDVAAEPFRAGASTLTIQKGDAVHLDLATPVTGYIDKINNAVAAMTVIHLEDGLPVNVPYNTLCYIGQESRILMTNVGGTAELRFYEKTSDTTNFITLARNLSTNVIPFETRGRMVIVDVQNAPPGDITGKGILRIRTEITSRTDPGFLQHQALSPTGIVEFDPMGTD